MTLVFMGDSITAGQYVVPASRWTDLVAARVRRTLEANAESPYYFYNRGISGETTRQGLERFARDVQEARPDVMTLQFGLNDCNCWDTDRGLPRVSEPAYRANLVEMIDRARHFGVKQIILSTNHRTLRRKKLANNRTLEENRIRYNETVREVAARTGAELCDIDKGFDRFSDEQLRELLLPEPDLLHLSPKGHDHYADLVFPQVMEAVHRCLKQPA